MEWSFFPRWETSSESQPQPDAVIQLASVINRTNYWKKNRKRARELGISRMDKVALKRFLFEGKTDIHTHRRDLGCSQGFKP
jgi:hypothetical protein